MCENIEFIFTHFLKFRKVSLRMCQLLFVLLIEISNNLSLFNKRLSPHHAVGVGGTCIKNRDIRCRDRCLAFTARKSLIFDKSRFRPQTFFSARFVEFKKRIANDRNGRVSEGENSIITRRIERLGNTTDKSDQPPAPPVHHPFRSR